MAQHRRGLALVGSVVLASTLCVATLHAPRARAAVTSHLTAVPGAPLDRVVTDASGHAFVSDPSRNEVDVVTLSSGTVEPIAVGSQPKGLDLTADGSTLYVANSGDDYVSVVDVPSRREVRRITIPPGELAKDTHPFSIAVANNGKALVTTSESVGFGSRMMQLDLATDAVTTRWDFFEHSLTTELTRVAASADRSHIAIVAGNLSSGPVFLYDAATDTFSPERDTTSPLSEIAAGGSSTVLLGHLGFVFGADLVLRGTINEAFAAYGVAVDATGTRGYGVLPSSVSVLDLTRNLVVGSIPLPEPVGSGSGAIAVSPDGSTLAVLTQSGVSVLSTADAVPVTCQGPTGPAPAAVLATCGAPLGDVVVDAGHAYATNTTRNQVEVVDLATGRLETPIPVGSGPAGLDFSPDGTRLYVADSGADEVSVVDLAQRRETSRITVPANYQFNDRPFSIAVLANGTALVSTTFDGVGYDATGVDGRVLKLDLTTGTANVRSDFVSVMQGRTTQFTRLRASGDRSKVAIVPGGTSLVIVYDPGTDSFASAHASGSLYQVAVDGTGSTILVSGTHTYVLDGQLAVRATLPDGYGGWGGLALNPQGTTGYGVTGTSIDVIDTVRGVVARSIPLPEGWGGNEMVALTPDETKLVALTRNGISIVSTAVVTTQSPYTVWSQPSAAPLDGIGTWVLPVNDPTATPGQFLPAYVYGHVFVFTGAPGTGLVALTKGPAGKSAVVDVVDGAGTSHTATVPFDWQAAHAYFLFAYELAPGSIGAWVYDLAAANWVPIGVLSVPTTLGKIASTSVTTATWYGDHASPCGVYPRADVLFYPPTGFVGTTATTATLQSQGTSAGDCSASNATEFSPWARYQLGAASAS